MNWATRPAMSTVSAGAKNHEGLGGSWAPHQGTAGPGLALLLTCDGWLSPAEQLPPRCVQEESAVFVVHRGQVLGKRVRPCG